MENSHDHLWRRFLTGLSAIGFGIGYFGNEIQPTISLLDSHQFNAQMIYAVVVAFAAGQILSYWWFGRQADHGRSRGVFQSTAILFILGAIIGTPLILANLIVSRLLLGIAAGSLGAVFRMASRLPFDKEPTRKTGQIVTSMIIGAAAAYFFPLIGESLGTGALGRGMINTFIAIAIGVLVYHMPKLGQQKQTNASTAIPSRAVTPAVAALILIPFFSAGAFLVFQTTMSHGIIPQIPINHDKLWFLIATASLFTGLIGNQAFKHKRPTEWENAGLTTALLLTTIVCLSPLLFTANNKPMAAIAVIAFSALTFADLGIEAFYVALVNRATDKRRAGQTLGIGFMFASAGRILWLTTSSLLPSAEVAFILAVILAFCAVCLTILFHFLHIKDSSLN